MVTHEGNRGRARVTGDLRKDLGFIPPEATIPQILTEMATHEYTRLRELEGSGLIDSPRAIATIAVSESESLIATLALCDPSSGATLLYGGICCGNFNQLLHSEGALSHTMELSTSHEDDHLGPVLSDESRKLLAYACLKALDARKPSCETNQRALNQYDQVAKSFTDYLGGIGLLLPLESLEPMIESQFPAFLIHRNNLNEIRRAMVSNGTPDQSFFAKTDPTVENYIKAAYSCSTPYGSPLRKRGLEFLGAIDSPLRDFIEKLMLVNYSEDPIIP